MKRVACWLVLAALAAAGCGTDDSGELEGSRISVAALRRGCVVECPPPCRPHEPCQQRPCRVVCPDGITPCGPTSCEPGQVCCNESCGICTPPGGACIQLYCEPTPGPCGVQATCKPGFRWSPARCACMPDRPPTPCRTDAECRLFADYCTGCDCVALSNGDDSPPCGLPGVRCAADPCANRRAACVDGQCVARPVCPPRPALCPPSTRWSETACACVRGNPPRPPRPERPARPPRPARF